MWGWIFSISLGVIRWHSTPEGLYAETLLAMEVILSLEEATLMEPQCSRPRSYPCSWRDW